MTVLVYYPKLAEAHVRVFYLYAYFPHSIFILAALGWAYWPLLAIPNIVYTCTISVFWNALTMQWNIVKKYSSRHVYYRLFVLSLHFRNAPYLRGYLRATSSVLLGPERSNGLQIKLATRLFVNLCALEEESSFREN